MIKITMAEVRSNRVVPLIDAFLEFCPKARYSFGHIVLDDQNLFDGDIEFCLKEEAIERWLSHRLSQSDSSDELAVARNIIEAFLRFLLVIPEDIRVDWIESIRDVEEG